MRILVAEDDEALGGFVRRGLEAEHYAVDLANDGEQTKSLAQQANYDLLLLDLNLPRLDGVTILRHLRVQKPSLPVLVLSARNRVEEKVQCLDLGADDFLAKPFAFAELSARIRALLRRCHTTNEAVLEVADLKLDRLSRVVQRGGRKIELTAREFALLEYLMSNAGRRVTRSMIAEHVFGLSFDTPSNLIDVYVAYATRNLTIQQRQKYFSQKGDKLEVNSSLRSLVTFSRLNLRDDARMLFMKGMDLILCCNVLIYFDMTSKRRVIQHFYADLLPHGYFFLGHSESLYGVSDDFRLVHLPAATAYVRNDARHVAGGMP